MDSGLLSGKKQAVVFDIGSSFIRCGFSLEGRPRHILRAHYALEDGTQLSFDSPASREEWQEALELCLLPIYFRYLQCTPKDYRVIVVDNACLPQFFRDALGYVLFTRLKVMSLLMLPFPVAAVLPLELRTAVVVDLGHKESRIMPIFEGLPILHAVVTTPMGGQTLLLNLGRLLKKFSNFRAVAAAPSTFTEAIEDAGMNDEDPATLVLEAPFNEELLEDLFTRLCVAKYGPEEGDDKEDPADFAFPLDGNLVVDVQGRVRTMAADPLFQNHLEAEVLSVPEALATSLLKCTPDLRGTLSQNIVLVGGGAMVPRIASRFLDAVNATFAEARFAPLAAMAGRVRLCETGLFQPNCLPWFGASLYGSIQEYSSHCLSREAYEKRPALPDWSVPAREATKAPARRRRPKVE